MPPHVPQPIRSDIRDRLNKLPDSIPPGPPADDDDPSGAVIVWVVVAALVYLVAIGIVLLIRLMW